MYNESHMNQTEIGEKVSAPIIDMFKAKSKKKKLNIHIVREQTYQLWIDHTVHQRQQRFKLNLNLKVEKLFIF